MNELTAVLAADLTKSALASFDGFVVRGHHDGPRNGEHDEEQAKNIEHPEGPAFSICNHGRDKSEDCKRGEAEQLQLKGFVHDRLPEEAEGPGALRLCVESRPLAFWQTAAARWPASAVHRVHRHGLP